MNTNLKEDKFILIQEAYILGGYDIVIQESCKIFESIMKKLFREAIGKFSYEDRVALTKAEAEIGKIGVGIEGFTFGETIGVFNKCDFFQRWGKHTQRNFSLIQSINFNLINDLRRVSAHENEKRVVKKEEAEYVYSHLKIFLATLGYTEFEKYISGAFDIRTQHSEEKAATKVEPAKRVKSIYDVLDKKEKRRLTLQRNLTKNEDLKVMKEILKDKSKVAVLDIGCNNGGLIIDRTEGFNNINQIIGIDLDENIIMEANEKYGSEKCKFYKLDSESENFSEDLLEVMEEHDIKSFDIIHLSMVLLYLKKPYKLLKDLRKVMNEDSYLFIRDIDDGLSLAYPDTKNIVERMKKISSKLETTGFRENGRQIYSLLVKAGFKGIKMYSESINTINKSHDEKEALFKTNFAYIIRNLKDAVQKYPEDKALADDYNWINESYEELEEMFQVEGFFYQMGSVVFTAQK